MSRLTQIALLLSVGCAEPTAPPHVVRDVTQLVNIRVDAEVRPTTTAEVQQILQDHQGPVSIGGGRFSMGGQVASENTLHIDMRQMNQVVSFDPHNKRITVQAGISWRGIQEHIDGDDLSVMIMQSYANFSVGGTLSVNAHGRYVNQGPVVHSVQDIELVLADGSSVHANRTENTDLFFGAIGGYASLGVITQVTPAPDD
ncbi:MAG: FAD-binding protein, partial [Rhodobacterales bacterium]|nr:FAD-binding protein [Rhodobacterales bacterium]